MSPHLQSIKTSKKAIQFLSRATKNATNATLHRQDPMLTVLFDRIKALDEQAPVVHRRYMTAYALRQKASTKRARRFETLRQSVAHFRSVVKFRNRRLDNAEWANSFYELAFEGNADKTMSGVTEMAQQLIFAEEDAVEHGLPAMANPSAAELQADLDAFNVQLEAAQQKDDVFRVASKEMARVLYETQGVHRLLATTLRVFHAADGKASCRQIMRKYGFEFSGGTSAADTPPQQPPVIDDTSSGDPPEPSDDPGSEPAGDDSQNDSGDGTKPDDSGNTSEPSGADDTKGTTHQLGALPEVQLVGEDTPEDMAFPGQAFDLGKEANG